MTALGLAYARYLRAGAAPALAAPLARALAGTPLAATSYLLDRYARGAAGTYSIATGELAGERVHVGARPPAAAAPGTLWFDVVDLSTSVLVPAFVAPEERDQLTAAAAARAQRNTQWFAMQPVPRFVFAGFAETARLQRERDDVLALDRLRAGDEVGAITAVSYDEACLYLYWIGKYVTTPSAWRAAKATLRAVPWGAPRRELAGREVVSPESLDGAPSAADGAPSPADVTLPADATHPADVTFRALVPTVWGLVAGTQASPMLGARVLARFARPVSAASG